MKSKIIKLITLCFFVNLQTMGQSIDKSVEHIRKVYNDINSMKLQQRIIQYKNKCGVENAIVTIYTDRHGVVRKITDIGVGDDDKAAAKWKYEYFYESNSLIFSYELSSGFDNETEKVYQEENREYILNNKVIKQIKNKKILFPKSYSIRQSDSRYRLKYAKNKTDIANIYECLN